jgi:hypothetical protein
MSFCGLFLFASLLSFVGGQWVVLFVMVEFGRKKTSAFRARYFKAAYLIFSISMLFQVLVLALT